MRVDRTILYLVFCGLLATPVLIGKVSHPHKMGAPIDPSAAVGRYGFYLEEVANEVGVSFVHQAPRLDPRLAHIEPQVAAYGASVAVVDVDKDGWQDLYVINSGIGTNNALYRNRRNGRFEEVARLYGVADLNREDTGVSMGSTWGDYDNDGYEDLFLYRWGRPELFHNEHGSRLTRVTDQAGLPAWINANTALWFDYDLDGYIDLFIGGYYPETVNLWHLDTTEIMPESLEYARNGGRNFLFHNRGDGTFEDVTDAMGLLEHRWTLAVGAMDLRGTGFPDLVVANDFGIEDVYFNESGRRFVEASAETGIGFAPKSGMNVSLGDVTNDGALSIYVSNISEPGFLLQGNNLWVPRRDGTPRYDNLASVFGIEFGGWSYGAQFGDFNNDGALDLYLVNGLVSGKPGTDYWYDMASFESGGTRLIRDAKNWPAMNGRSLSGFQTSRLWLNRPRSGFQDVAAAVGAADDGDGRAVAVADLWNRGVLDIIVANQRGPLLIYRNTVANDRNWIDFELEGTASNRSAVGATVTVYRAADRMMQQVAGASGFASQNQRRLHFGLGSDGNVDYVLIHWPSGTEDRIEKPEANRVYRVVESTGAIQETGPGS